MRRTKDKTKLLFEIAESQEGLFTARQAEEVGFIRSNHAYHVKKKHWVRVERGIYRLALFPISRDEQMVTYSLWSQNREGKIQGVYSHETALSYYELTDLMPAKLHLTVPKSFRRNSEIPKVLRLHYADLSQEDVQRGRGFLVTKPLRTIRDVIECERISLEFVEQAMRESVAKGLVRRSEMEHLVNSVSVSDDVRKQLKIYLRSAA